MTGYIDDLDSAEREIRSLQRSVSELESRCDRIESQASDTEHTWTDLSGQVETLREETEQGISDAHAEVLSVRAAVSILTGQVRWLEHHLRTAAGITPARLTVPDAAALAATIRKAGQARAALLTAVQRDQLTSQLTHQDQLRDLQQECENTALAHSKTIAETAPDDPARGPAVTCLATARSQYQTFAARLREQQPAFDTARGRLGADDQQRDRLAPVITAGGQARATLHAQARAAISAAIEGWALMPAWFTAALGYQPPAPDTGTWLETAASLLAFRLAYAITDPVNALGSHAEDGDPDRQQWRGELDRKLR